MRTALITGASRGIGLACAQQLAKAGHRVVLAARNLERLEEAAAAIRTDGGEASVLVLDLANGETIKTAIASVGAVDILVNNAGVTKDTLALRMKPDDWNSVIQTNLTGSFLCMQAAMQGMMKERWGRIVNIASVVAEMGNAGQSNYAASKAGLIGLTKSLAQELASRNITVNAITPGFIETDMTAVLTDAQKEKMLGFIPLKRFGTAADVAGAVKFLASEEASYITGHVLKVNGGMYM